MSLLSRLLRGSPRTRSTDLSDPAARRRALLHYNLIDHAILRHHWTNMDEIAPGVWRSNQPTHARFVEIRAAGIKSILNLRGTAEQPRFLFEKESCEALGLRLTSVMLHARKPPARDQVLKLFEAFRTLERPFLMHCKSGADRAGFASALYLMAHEGWTVAQARRHLSFRYLHVRASKAGVLGRVLDLYEARLARGPIGIEEWFATDYDLVALRERR